MWVRHHFGGTYKPWHIWSHGLLTNCGVEMFPPRVQKSAAPVPAGKLCKKCSRKIMEKTERAAA